MKLTKKLGITLIIINANKREKMVIVNKFSFTIFILFLTAILSCGLINQRKKNVRILRITANIPEGKVIKVKNTFKSVPWLCFCGGISMRDGSFIPDNAYKIEYIDKSGQVIEMPLTWIWKSLCEWTYYSTSIIVTDTLKEKQITKQTIYHDRGDLPLSDTINIPCRHCINPCRKPAYYYDKCADSLEVAINEDIFYSLAENKEDTVNLTINMYFSDDSIHLCNEELRDCYEKWKADE